MGKATGKDAAKGKNTYPSLIGVDASAKAAREQLEAALAAVRGFDDGAAGLQALARFVVERKS
jgi:geranylgeranyl diphosphate synthase type II